MLCNVPENAILIALASTTIPGFDFEGGFGLWVWRVCTHDATSPQIWIFRIQACHPFNLFRPSAMAYSASP